MPRCTTSSIYRHKSSPFPTKDHKGSSLKNVVCRRGERWKIPGMQDLWYRVAISCPLQASCISDFTQSICCSDRLRSGLRPSSGGGFLKPARPSGYSKYSTYRQSSKESFRTARCGPLSARRVVREILSISMDEVDPDKLIFTMLRPPPLGSVTFQVPAAAKPSLFNVNIPSDFRVSSSSVNFPCGFHCHTATNSSIISWEASKLCLFQTNDNSLWQLLNHKTKEELNTKPKSCAL